jgi:hypothetical protein
MRIVQRLCAIPPLNDAWIHFLCCEHFYAGVTPLQSSPNQLLPEEGHTPISMLHTVQLSAHRTLVSIRILPPCWIIFFLCVMMVPFVRVL